MGDVGKLSGDGGDGGGGGSDNEDGIAGSGAVKGTSSGRGSPTNDDVALGK